MRKLCVGTPQRVPSFAFSTLRRSTGILPASGTRGCRRPAGGARRRSRSGCEASDRGAGTPGWRADLPCASAIVLQLPCVPTRPSSRNFRARSGNSTTAPRPCEVCVGAGAADDFPSVIADHVAVSDVRPIRSGCGSPGSYFQGEGQQGSLISMLSPSQMTKRWLQQQEVMVSESRPRAPDVSGTSATATPLPSAG